MPAPAVSNLAKVACLAHHDRNPARECFQDGDAEPFLPTGQTKASGAGEGHPFLLPIERPSQDHAVCQFGIGYALFEIGTRAIVGADDD